MALWICPNCNNSGALFTCKECQTIMCTSCKTIISSYGQEAFKYVKFKTPDNQCPICKGWAVLVHNEP